MKPLTLSLILGCALCVHAQNTGSTLDTSKPATAWHKQIEIYIPLSASHVHWGPALLVDGDSSTEIYKLTCAKVVDGKYRGCKLGHGASLDDSINDVSPAKVQQWPPKAKSPRYIPPYGGAGVRP